MHRSRKLRTLMPSVRHINGGTGEKVHDGRSVRSFDDFVAAVNLGLVERVGGKWNCNLDALNDYLSWPEESEYQIELLRASNCDAHLGHAAQASWLIRSWKEICKDYVDHNARFFLARTLADIGGLCAAKALARYVGEPFAANEIARIGPVAVDSLIEVIRKEVRKAGT